MKTDKISLKWKLFFYILIFAGSIILLFSLFQIVLLDDFYRSIKTNDINNLTQDAYTAIQKEKYEGKVTIFDSLKTKLNKLANDNEAFIYIYEKNDEDYNQIYGSLSTSSNQDIINDMDIIWTTAHELYSTKLFYIIFKDDTNPEFKTMVTDNSRAQERDYLICGMILDNDHMLIVDSRLTPVEPAVQAMTYQIMYISLIVVALAIVVALLLSRTISKPIIIINESAKKMAEGDLNIEFSGKGYLEITELNNTLNHTIEELKKTETLHRELIANVSHDLRTPLTLISGYAEMMKDLPDENTEENIQVIIDETKRLSLLVNDLLNLSRIQSRTEELNLSSFDICSLVEGIVERQNKFFEGSNVIINYHSKLKDVFVKADIKKIEQVIYNFISNAINYSGKDKIVDVILENINDSVRISVKDYGIGIKKEHLEFIWQRYYRVDKGLQRSTQGTGLGLSIIKEILDYHGFNYGVDSCENVGSTFYFEMPIDKKQNL